jgi:transposase-like protein
MSYSHTAYCSDRIKVGVNKQGLELFAGVSDMEGEGLPVSFLFYENNGKAADGAKQRVLTSWYEALKRKGFDPEFTLSDKDDSEINAMRAVWPLAKHQLCLWHAIRALKRRLAKLKQGLSSYNAGEAHTLFDFIDSQWLPYSMLRENEVC